MEKRNNDRSGLAIAATAFISTASLALFSGIYTYYIIRGNPEPIPFFATLVSAPVSFISCGLLHHTYSIKKTNSKQLDPIFVTFYWLSMMAMGSFFCIVVWFCISFIADFHWTPF